MVLLGQLNTAPTWEISSARDGQSFGKQSTLFPNEVIALRH